MMDEKDIIFELECAKANLEDDIQALAYIEDDLETSKVNEHILKIPEMKNQMQILLKAMIYNKNEMQQAIDKYYKKINEEKEVEK